MITDPTMTIQKTGNIFLKRPCNIVRKSIVYPQNKDEIQQAGQKTRK